MLVERPLRGERGVFQLPPPPARDDLALVVPTSGTTGRPARVPLTFGNVHANARGVQRALGLGEQEERWLCPLPLSHVGGLMCVIRSALMATTCVLAPPPFDTEAVAAQLATAASRSPRSCPPSSSGCSTPAPRPARRCGGSCSAAARCRARCSSARATPASPSAPSYGLTQACSTVSVAEPGDLETAGRPLTGVGVAVAEDGEILVSGPTVNSLGSLRTGDLGRLLQDGRLVVTGRKGEMIVTGGENVAPAEVESVLAAHPSVAEAAVFARPDPEWGEAVAALVVPRPGAAVTADELRAHCAERLAGYKVPKAFELVAELPRTESGKVRRADLR